MQTTGAASGLSGPGTASATIGEPVSDVPSRFMNAAIARRLTTPVGQYSVVDVQPTVTPRFFTHSTLEQNALAESTSVKPAQGWAATAFTVWVTFPLDAWLPPSPP